MNTAHGHVCKILWICLFYPNRMKGFVLTRLVYFFCVLSAQSCHQIELCPMQSIILLGYIGFRRKQIPVCCNSFCYAILGPHDILMILLYIYETGFKPYKVKKRKERKLGLATATV